MADAGADAAQRYRAHMREKADRLGGGEDAGKVDASDFTPAEKLYAGVKTGMRPVSRQARADGGVVSGGHAAATPGRAPRKSGGGFGTAFTNRDAKAADEDREGHYPNGGMNKGGRARASGGEAHGPGAKMHRVTWTSPKGRETNADFHSPERAENFRQDISAPLPSGRPRRGTSSTSQVEGERPTPIPRFMATSKEGAAKGGRAGRAEGGYIPREGGPSETRALKRKTASSEVETSGRPAAEDGRQGRASGGRAGKADGGPLATPLAAGMGGQGRMNFNFAPGRATAAGLKDGGRAKAHERYGHGPSCTCSSCRKGKAGGGPLALDEGLIGMIGNAFRGGGDQQNPLGPTAAAAGKADGGGVGQPSLKHPAPKHGSRAHTLAEAKQRANGGAAPGPDENDPTPDSVAAPGAAVGKSENAGGRYNRTAVQSAINQSNRSGRRIGGKEARMIHAVLKGRQREDYADGGVAEGALKQHKLEHKAIGKAKGGSLRRPHIKHAIKTLEPSLESDADFKLAKGGRAAHAHGGKAGKGKTNINIIIGSHPGGLNAGPGDPANNPALAIKPPPAGPPMPMPMPGGAPPPAAGAPMPIPMPMPMPGGGGPPPGMPPRARGGRAPPAGAGSGLGRLEKTRAYGKRSHEGEGLRK